MFFHGPDLYSVGPLVLSGFAKHLPAKYTVGEDQINVLLFERYARGTTMPYGKFGRGYCILSIKELDEVLRLQLLRQKTLNFTQTLHLNWLAKIKLRGPGPQVVNIIVKLL